MQRAHLAGSLAAAVVPPEPQAQRVLDLWGGRPGEPRRAGPHPGIGREPVDVLAGEARVVDRREAGLDREVEVAALEVAPDLGLPDARDHRLALERVRRAHAGPPAPAGRNSGKKTSSCCSKTTSTAIPIRTSSTATSTRLVISRTRSSSSIATRPTR